MLDYNHTRSFADMLNEVVDAALMDENAAHPRREYLGGSRVGHACERALQFEFAHAPKDEGADFPGRTLRIFAIGHALEDLLATLTAWCEAQSIPYSGVPVGTWKRHACGKGNADKQAVIAAMREQGIGIGVHYPAIHLFKLYRALGYREGQFPHTERIARAIITLPLFPAMQDDDVDRVCDAMAAILLKARRAA